MFSDMDVIPVEPLPAFDLGDVEDDPTPIPQSPASNPLTTETPQKEAPQSGSAEGTGRRRSTLTRTYSPGGDPKEVAKVISGLTIIGLSSLAVWLRRKGKHLRMPDERQRDAFARPLANILVRHLPLTEIGPDLADITAAATAVHNYVSNSGEPLVTKVNAELQLPLPEGEYQ